jgi:hypothetical protein
MTPEEIIDKLEQRIGHEGRVIFENFVREMQRLEARQQLEQQQLQQEEQERRQRRRQHHGVSPSGDAGSGAIERALAIAAATNAHRGTTEE